MPEFTGPRHTPEKGKPPKGKPGPTRHRPGTRGKLVVLACRAALGLPLFHPGDAPAAEEGQLPRGVSVLRKIKTVRGVQVPGRSTRYRAKALMVVQTPDGRLVTERVSVGCFRSVAEALAAVADYRRAYGCSEVDGNLRRLGWSVENEDPESEGGSGG